MSNPERIRHKKPAPAEQAVDTRLPETEHNDSLPRAPVAASHHFAQISVVALQAKLTVNTPGDVYEQEADRVAEQVTQMESPATGEAPVTGRADDELQAKSNPNDPPTETGVDPGVYGQQGGGQALDSVTRSYMEPRFGHDFSQVRIHADTRAATLARSINALAFTVGNSITFGAGQYQPGSASGQKLLAHELAHVVQQQHAPQIQRQEKPPSSGMTREEALGKMDCLHILWSITNEGYDAEYPTVQALPAGSIVDPASIPLTMAALARNGEPTLHPDPAKKLLNLELTDTVGTGKPNHRADILVLQDVLHSAWHMTNEAYDTERAAVNGVQGDTVADSLIPLTIAGIGRAKEALVKHAGTQGSAPASSSTAAAGGGAATPAAGAAASPAATPAAATTFKTQTYQLSNREATLVKGSDKKKMAEIKEAPADYADRILRNAGLDPKTWFASFTTTTFLGRAIGDPIHTDLAAHLKDVEKKIAEKHGGASKDPAEAGKALGLNETIAGARPHPTSAALSMHLFGLALDINYTANPFISESANPVFKRAGELVSGQAGAFKNNMSYDDLHALDVTLETYFSYIDNADALKARLDAATDGFWKGKSPEAAVTQINADLTDVSGRWERGKKKDVIKASGFMDLHKDLVDMIGLSWGASYGDIMHFDMRNKGNGRKIQSAIGAYKAEKEAESKKKWADEHPAE